MAKNFEFTTKLWQRSQSSFATTVPQNILAIKDAPVENAEIAWSINSETGKVEVEFREREGDDQ